MENRERDLNHKLLREQMESVIVHITGKERESLRNMSFDNLRKDYIKVTSQTEQKYDDLVRSEIAKKDKEAYLNSDDAWLMLSYDEKIIALGIIPQTLPITEDLEHNSAMNKKVKELLEKYDELLKDNEEQQLNFIEAEKIINDHDEPYQNKTDARNDRLSAKESTRRNNKKIASIIKELLIFEVPLASIINKILALGKDLTKIIIKDIIEFDEELAIIIIREMISLGIELPAEITKTVEQSLK